MWNDNNSERKTNVYIKKNNAEIVADRLIMDGVQFDSPQFEAAVKEAWEQVYPGTTAPDARTFYSVLWSSTRAMMERPSIRQVHWNHQLAFACERFIHFHIVRLYPDVRMHELRKAVEADMLKAGLDGFDDSKAMLAYRSRQDPERADPGRTSFSQKEAALIIAMYQWLVEQYENKSQRQTPQQAPAASTSSNAPQSVTTEPAASVPERQEERVIEVSIPVIPLPSPASPAPERPERRRRRSGHGRSRSPEELEARTLARIKGQLAIDLLVMDREAGMDVESDEDIEASERLQFISACQACPELPDEYRDEQNIIRMWDVITPQDKMLFTAGSLTDLLDSRFTIITCRCLLLAISRLDNAAAFDKAAILASAFELWEAFHMDSRPDSVKKLLERNIYRYYMVGNGIPEQVVALLHSKADDIRDAYNMYLEQILEEQKQREIQFNAKLASQRKVDQFHQQITQRASLVELIKKFTALEDGAALGWLCMAVNGADYSREKLCYYIENLIQRLENVGLKPVGVDKVACVFDGDSEGTEIFVDMGGHPLKAGSKYQMAQLGWMFDGEIVVYPMAEQV